jgi:hypothetical protein
VTTTALVAALAFGAGMITCYLFFMFWMWVKQIWRLQDAYAKSLSDKDYRRWQEYKEAVRRS